MQLPQPYLHTSERMVAIVDRPQIAPAEGIIADALFGYHTIWAAEVPFIPARRKEEGGNFNLEEVMQRQERFLYELAQTRDNLATFELRLVAWPQVNGPTRVGIVFLGKVFHPDATISRQLALGQWDKFSALFPREAPFSYPLVPVGQHETAAQPHSFIDWFLPLPFEHITSPQSIVELRKYEDWPSMRDMGNILHAHDYIPHPYVVAHDHTTMARLFETLARQQQITVVAITLRPQKLTDQEVMLLNDFSGWYKHTPEKLPETMANNRLIQKWHELYQDSITTYKQARAQLGQKVYGEFVREYRNLMLVRLQIIGDPVAQDDVIEALGALVTTHTENTELQRWSRVEVTSIDELYWARFNVQWLEFARWGISPLIQQDRRIIRLRQLATRAEITGVFALPVAPDRDTLAGIEVRNEPFTVPGGAFAEFDERCDLGKVLDRGIPTTLRFSLPSARRTGLVQIFGENNAYRAYLVERLLTANAALPWVLLRKGTVPGKTQAERIAARYICLDSTSPIGDLGFHPLLPPPGVALTTFLDALLRILLVVCGLDTSATPALRQALYKTYQDAGWTDQEAYHSIDLSALAEQIDRVAQNTVLPALVAVALRRRCVPLLQDLALTTAHLQHRNSELPTPSLTEPIVIDIGWLGSESNNALFYGCLWVWYALAFSALPIPAEAGAQRGIIGLEDAHMLFTAGSPTAAGGASLATFIHARIHSGIGTLLIDDRPDLLDKEMTNQANVTMLTRSTIISVQERVTKLLGASASQQERIAHMHSTEALVKLQEIAPIHITL